MASPCLEPVPNPCAPLTTDPRLVSAFTRKYNTALRAASLAPVVHPTNGDESLPDKIGTYSKCILQDGKGRVNLAAFNTFTTAIAAGTFAQFNLCTLGGSRSLNGPMGAYAYNFFGADNSQFTTPVPYSVASEGYATELVELYWASLLRDVAFSDLSGHQLAEFAAEELTALPEYQGPRDGGGKVIPSLLFRGSFPGETVGPYVSQFLVTPTTMGAQPISQQYITYLPFIDYMTDEVTWEAVQQGKSTGFMNQSDATARYLRDGRSLAAFTHVDVLFQAYFTAFLVLSSLNVPVNPGNPYNASSTQNGFGTFGGPDFASTLAQVAKIALDAVWYQKWVVHLRHRPESGGGLVYYSQKGETYSVSLNNVVLHSQAVQASCSRHGTALLSQPFPEGSPSHPAYPTGHGTVGGACITVLKFFFNGDYILTNPKVPASDGLSLNSWIPDASTGLPGNLTVNGELHKLAHNITFGHGLHGGIHWRSDSDASIQLGEKVAISFLEDLVCTYPEPFQVTITKLDGSTHTFKNL